LNSLVLTMWRLSGHHLLAASLAHARMSTINHATNDSTHPAAPSSMQHVHAASAMHQTCTAARGSMAHRMYLPHRHAARDAHASAGCTLAVCAPFARCDGVHAHEGSDHSKAGNCAHAELHVDAGGDVSAHSECCARCNAKSVTGTARGGTYMPSGENWGEPTHLKASEKSMRTCDVKQDQTLRRMQRAVLTNMLGVRRSL